MEKEKRNKLIVLIAFLVALIWPIINILTASRGLTPQDMVVPLSGLQWTLHVIVFYILVPQLLSILLIVIFPLTMLPLFLMLKRKVWYKFKEAYVDMGELGFSLKIFVKRGIYVSLLLVGIIITISDLLDPTLFLTPVRLAETHYSGNLLFDPDVISSLAYLIVPIVVGIWSVGWTMEDSGLMHYRIPKENEKFLFEIEPVHLKYNGIVKGYTGISSIIFLIITISMYISIWPAHIFQVIILIILMMFYTAPAYFIYIILAQRLFRKIYRKGLTEIEQPTEDNIVVLK